MRAAGSRRSSGQRPPGGPVEIVVGSGLPARDPLSPDAGAWALALSLSADPATHLYLNDHQLAGKPVVPLAMHMEWLSQAALQAVPGGTLLSLEDVRLLKGITLDAPARLAVWAGQVQPCEGGLRVALELRSGDTLHSRATATVGRRGAAPVLESTLSREGLEPYPHPLAEVYGELLFHGPRLHCIAAVEGMGERGMALRVRAAPPPETWITSHPPARWVTDPLIIDGVFQALILWTRAMHDAPSLPSRLGALRLLREALPEGEVTLRIAIREEDESTVVSDVEILDAGGVLAKLEGYVCTTSKTLEMAFARGSAEAEARS